MENNKKRTIKDILAEIDAVSSSKNNRADITGLEEKIPVVSNPKESSKIEQTGTDPIRPMEDTPPPIQSMSNQAPIFEDEDSTKKENETTKEDKTANKQDISNKEDTADEKDQDLSYHSPDDDIMTTPKTDVFKINKIEDLEDKLVKFEEESRHQKILLESQRTEIDEYLTKLGELESENKKLKSELSNAEANVKINFEAQLNKASMIEEKYLALAKTHEEMKARVRRDIRKISMREKELANKIELMKNDSDTLLKSKDNKILQLKQHIDNLDFEIDTLKDKLQTAQNQAKESEEKAERVVKALRLSTSLLETAKK
jgi:DNA repair exonuclease SbcCD ATPase subunit